MCAATCVVQGGDGTPATHFTLEATDPSTAIRVARTYFLRSSCVPVIPGVRMVDAATVAAAGHMLFDISEIEVSLLSSTVRSLCPRLHYQCCVSMLRSSTWVG